MRELRNCLRMRRHVRQSLLNTFFVRKDMWVRIRGVSVCGMSLLIGSSIIGFEPVLLPRPDIANCNARAGSSEMEAAGSANDVRLLTPGQLIEQELSSGSVHSYQVN